MALSNGTPRNEFILCLIRGANFKWNSFALRSVRSKLCSSRSACSAPTLRSQARPCLASPSLVVLLFFSLHSSLFTLLRAQFSRRRRRAPREPRPSWPLWLVSRSTCQHHEKRTGTSFCRDRLTSGPERGPTRVSTSRFPIYRVADINVDFGRRNGFERSK